MFALIRALRGRPQVSTSFRNGFKSDISLDKLYPSSNLDLLQKPDFKLEAFDKEKRALFTGFIPIEKLNITNITCSKPGGQNVNKSQKGVEIRFHVDKAEWIPDWIREKIKTKYASRINKNGYLIVTSEKTRSNLLNQADCLERIRAVVFEAGVVQRGLTKDELNKIEINKRIAEGRRLLEKKKLSEKRTLRKSPIYDQRDDDYKYF